MDSPSKPASGSPDPAPASRPSAPGPGTPASTPADAPQVSPAPSPPAIVTPRLDRYFFLRLSLQVAGVLLAGIALLVLLGLAQRQGWIGASEGTSAQPAADGSIYTCPMHPQIRQPVPGRCPICGMPLERVASASDVTQDELATRIEPAARRLANIQTAAVVRRPVEQSIATVGRIAADESRLATLSAYIGGRVERLFADYTGVQVAKGDHLAVLYSPNLYSAQVEYVSSRRSLQEMTGAPLAAVRRAQERLVESTRQRLVELGLTPEQLAELERSQEPQSRVTIYAPIGGTVIEKLVVEGAYVEAGEPIYRIANLSSVWLMLQLYPEDASRIRFGQEVAAEVQSLPGEHFAGRVAFVDPVVDERTRTVGVRVEMPNPDGKLRPGDYARATVSVPLGARGETYDAALAGKWISPMHPQIVRDEPGACPICGMDLVPTSRYGFSDQPVEQPTALVVPRSAVLMGGSQSLVYIETEPGRFEIRPVTLGAVLRDEVVIVSGVEEGEQVATSGNFLIDSQMQLAGKPSLIDPTRAVAQSSELGGPLDVSGLRPQVVAGAAGERLEELFSAYLAIQAALAADQVPGATHVDRLSAAGRALVETEGLEAAVAARAERVVEQGAHLHHMALDDARSNFKSISHEMVRLAAEFRGAQATQPLRHLWCSMVPGGGGDWLQGEPTAANPYWGSKMLDCFQHEQILPLPRAAESPVNADQES